MRERDVAKYGLKTVTAHSSTTKVGCWSVLGPWRGAPHVAPGHIAHPWDKKNNPKKTQKFVVINWMGVLAFIILQLLVGECDDERQVLDWEDLLKVEKKE